MSNDSGKSLPYSPGGSVEGASSSENASFANIYPSGVAPCYSQGLSKPQVVPNPACTIELEFHPNQNLWIVNDIFPGLLVLVCIDGACPCQTANAKAESEKILKAFRPTVSNSNQDVFRITPEETFIKSTSAPHVPEGYQVDEPERGETNEGNTTNGDQGDESRLINVLSRIKPEQFRARLTKILRPRDRIENGREESVSKP
ncbi:hypothetical protein DFH28DRAFT_1123827 [Melampsora americana]|nr:hypothetical protein DFH28DRAFT_1123827 [Melampsora americana]